MVDQDNEAQAAMHDQSESGPRPERPSRGEVHILGKKIRPFWPFLDGLEYDTEVGLSYLNARYYDGTRGQFLRQDPVFTFQPEVLIGDPQQMNSYSYARNNPVVLVDPQGQFALTFAMRLFPHLYRANTYLPERQQIALGQAADQLSQDNRAWDYAISHPVKTSIVVAAASLPALAAGGGFSGALAMATYSGVSSSYAAQYAFLSVLYAGLTVREAMGIPEGANKLNQIDLNQRNSIYGAAGTLLDVGMSVFGSTSYGEDIGEISDAVDIFRMFTDGYVYLANKAAEQGNNNASSASQSVGSSVSGGGIGFSGGDFNGDGAVNSIDWGIANTAQ